MITPKPNDDLVAVLTRAAEWLAEDADSLQERCLPNAPDDNALRDWSNEIRGKRRYAARLLALAKRVKAYREADEKALCYDAGLVTADYIRACEVLQDATALLLACLRAPTPTETKEGER